MASPYRLSAERKDAFATETEPDPNDADEFERRLALVLIALADGWTKRAASRITYPKSRKGTRHWTPEYENDYNVGTKALDASKAVDSSQWQTDAEEQTHPIIEAAAIAAAVALLLDIGFTPPNGESLREFAVRATKATVTYMVGMIGKFAAGQGVNLVGDVNGADQDGADLDTLRTMILDRAERLRSWSEGVATLVAFGTTNKARDDAAEEAVAAEPDLHIERIWWSRRDEKVRQSHRKADGQIRALDEPFVVGGALLRFPQDPLAPIRETARCRCHIKHRSRRTGQFVTRPTTIKALRMPLDGDGDGFVYDGTPRQRPAVPAPTTGVSLRLARPNESAIAQGASRIGKYRAEAKAAHVAGVATFTNYADARGTLEKAFTVDFKTPRGRSVGVRNVSVDVDSTADGTTSYMVNGDLLDLDTGDPVGFFDRELISDGTAYHAGLTIEPKAQSEGIASEFNAHAIAWYRSLGIKEIRVSASGTISQAEPGARPPDPALGDLEAFAASLTAQIAHARSKPMNGGYTWGQQGFDFRDQGFETTLLGRLAARMAAQPEFGRYVHDGLTGWDHITPQEQNRLLGTIGVAASANMTTPASIVDALPEDWWDDPDQRKILADWLATLDLDNPPTPWEVNLLGSHDPFTDKDTGLPTWLGKALMSRSNWEGRFDMTWLDLYPETKALQGEDRDRVMAGLMLASLSGAHDDGLDVKSVRQFAHALDLAERLGVAKPRHSGGVKAAPHDGDGDGYVDDGTPQERPAPGPLRWTRIEGGYVSSERSYVLLRMARMSAGGTNGWAILRQTPEDAVGSDGPGSGAYDTRNGDPLHKFGDVWYSHVNDEGSLGDAKITVEALRGRPQAPAPVVTPQQYRSDGYDVARERFEAVTDVEMLRRWIAPTLDARDATADPGQRSTYDGILDYLHERVSDAHTETTVGVPD